MERGLVHQQASLDNSAVGHDHCGDGFFYQLCPYIQT